MKTDKSSMRNNMKDKRISKKWPDPLILQWSCQAIIMVSCSTWMITKINGVTPDLFCTGVIGHPRYVFLN